MGKIKILLACPVSIYKIYILFDWLNYIKEKLIVPHGAEVDVLLVDNSKTVQLSRKIKNLGVEVIYRPGRANERLNDTMAACNNVIAKHVTGNNYDYYFSLECDIFPPPDILKRLLSHGKDVVSACYNIGFYDTRRLMLQFPYKTENNTIDIKNVSFMQGFMAINGQLLKVAGCGMGCMLIKSSVLQGYLFRTDPALEIHADTFFALDLYKRGFELWLDTGVFCRHYNSNWNIIKKKYNDRKRPF